MSDGSAEDGHDRVAEKLIDRPIVSPNDRNESLEAGVNQPARLFRIHLLRQLHEARNICKHHGNDLALFIPDFRA